MTNLDSMKTDRELLVLAAQAAGIEWCENDEAGNLYQVRHDLKALVIWNPLADDGQALRLAAKLEINIHFNRKHVDAECESRSGHVFSEFSKDRDAATRIAIVRAAAEIGRNIT